MDQKIVLLLKERLDYVKRAGELKTHRKSVRDQKREDRILLTVAHQAELAGYPGYIAIAVFKTILAQSNKYEKRFHHYSNIRLSRRPFELGSCRRNHIRK